jgi:hypothetical protein
MKKVITISLLSVLFLPGILRAQGDTVPDLKNAVKLNTMALIFNNGSLIYERNLRGRWSVQAGAGYRYGGGIPKALGLGDLILTSKTKGIKGYSFTPEVRYYFRNCECRATLAGLYLGLYTRYTRLFGDLSFHYWTGSEYIDLLSASSYRELGMGIQLGYQLIIKKRFLVDFMFAGPRLSTNKIRCTINSDYMDELAPAIEEEINKRLEWLGQDPISVDIPDGSTAEARFRFTNFRYGISFGYLF